MQSTSHLLLASRVATGNFRKFSLIVNITDNLGTSADPNKTMHATPMSTINHENNLLVLLLVQYYTVSQKNMSPYFCPYLRHIWTNFKNSFTGTLCGKFAINWLLIVPPHLNCIATLPGETLMYVKLTSCSQFMRTATFRTLQKVQTKIAANDQYDTGLC